MKHTKPTYLRDGTTVYALTPNTDPIARRRRETPLVNRFSAQVAAGGRDGAPYEELKAVAEQFRAAPEMDAAIRALIADFDTGTFNDWATRFAGLRRHIEALRAALPKEE